MSEPAPEHPFFIGWQGPRGATAWLPLLLATTIVLGLFAILGWVAARGTAEPASIPAARLAVPDTPVEATRRGLLIAQPYPAVWSAPDRRSPAGHTTLLTGDGKHGLALPADLVGKAVEIKGQLFKRGSLDMLVVYDAPQALPDTPQPLPVSSLGRWRLSGEICDGKCYAGAMRPGSGLAHKACANLCLLGKVPPVFVSAAPLDGHEYFLIADAAGHPLGDAVHDLTAVPLTLDAELEQRGDALVIKTDLAGARIK